MSESLTIRVNALIIIVLLVKYYKPALDWQARWHNRKFQWINYYRRH